MVEDKRRSKLKVHITFGGAILLVFLISLISPMASGEGFLQAAWQALRETRPVEWMMIILFWSPLHFKSLKRVGPEAR